MKLTILLTITLLLLSTTAFAESVSFSINGQTSDLVTVAPGDEIKISVAIEPNTYVYGVDIETKDELLSEIIGRQMSIIERHDRSEEYFEEKFGFVAPDVLPAGQHEVFVTIDYSDSGFVDQTSKQVITLSIPKEGQNGMVGFFTGLLGPDGAAEVTNKIMDTTIEPLSREPTQEEILRLANKQGFDASKATYRKVAESKKVVSDDLETYLASSTNEELTKALKELKKEKKPIVTKDLEVYEITSEETVTHLSKIIISIEYPDESLNNVVIVENIPKEVAAHVNDLTFSHKPFVIEEDPIVKWQFDHIPQEETQQVSYTVDGELEEVPGETYAGGSESGFFAKLIAQIIESLMGSSEE